MQADVLIETGRSMVGRIWLTKDCFFMSGGYSQEVCIILNSLMLSASNVTLSPHGDTVMIELGFDLYDEVER